MVVVVQWIGRARVSRWMVTYHVGTCMTSSLVLIIRNPAVA